MKCKIPLDELPAQQTGWEYILEIFILLIIALSLIFGFSKVITGYWLWDKIPKKCYCDKSTA